MRISCTETPIQQIKENKRKREWDYNLSKAASGITGFVDKSWAGKMRIGIPSPLRTLFPEHKTSCTISRLSIHGFLPWVVAAISSRSWHFLHSPVTRRKRDETNRIPEGTLRYLLSTYSLRAFQCELQSGGILFGFLLQSDLKHRNSSALKMKYFFHNWLFTYMPRQKCPSILDYDTWGLSHWPVRSSLWSRLPKRLECFLVGGWSSSCKTMVIIHCYFCTNVASVGSKVGSTQRYKIFRYSKRYKHKSTLWAMVLCREVKIVRACNETFIQQNVCKFKQRYFSTPDEAPLLLFLRCKLS